MTDPVPSKDLSELYQWLIDKANDSDPYDSQMFTKAMSIVGDRLAPEPEPTHFAFLIKRPRDSEAWPTIFASREGAEGYEHRASEVVPVRLAQPPRDGQG